MASAAASRDPSRAPPPAPLNPQEPPTENGCESSGCNNPSSTTKVHFEQNNKRDSSGSDISTQLRTHRRNLKKVRGLASAILQVAQMLEEKYLKSPLGEDEKAKKKRLKREEDRRKKLAEEAAEAGEGGEGDVLNTSSTETHFTTPFQDWETSLMASTSAAQLF